jgi:hypothetical protein
MHKNQIVVGKSYVNDDASIVREVVEEVDSRRVKFNAFELRTGKLIPARPQVCRKSQLARWADRETSQHETARIHPFNPGAWFVGVPDREAVEAQLERVKASMAQTAASQAFHRW